MEAISDWSNAALAVPLSIMASSAILLAVGHVFQIGIYQRYAELCRNWREHTLRSILEVSCWIGSMVNCYTASPRNGNIAALYLMEWLGLTDGQSQALSAVLLGSISGLVVVSLSDLVYPMLNKKGSRETNTTAATVSTAAVLTFLLLPAGSRTLSRINQDAPDATTAIALCTIASILLVLVSEFLVRWGPTKHAGPLVKDRMMNGPYNWRNHPVRSSVESLVWLGCLWGRYSVDHSVFAAIEFGTVGVVLTVLLLGIEKQPSSPRMHHHVRRLQEAQALAQQRGSESSHAAKPAPTAPLKGSAVYTAEEVARHNTFEDAWLIVNDEVYDVTRFIKKHPGGDRTLARFLGRDATDEVIAFHKQSVIGKYLRALHIGHLATKNRPSRVQVEFRKLLQHYEAQGYFQPNPSYYRTKLTILLSGFAVAMSLVLFSDNSWHHVASAIILAAVWQQIAFIAHDGGHMSISTDRAQDYNLCMLIANGMGGVSIGWWKDTHNVHHSVPNTLEHDPDIAHLPALAISDKMFRGVYNTFHHRVMEFDLLARTVVPYQHYLYYVFMAFGRLNLYLQSLIRLLTTKTAENRLSEAVTLVGFFIWFPTLLYCRMNSAGMTLLYVALSHGLCGILHVQITLSHFAMPVWEGKDYGGDFYTRNIHSSMDVDCSSWLDWFHGGLQFQTLHHCFPRMSRCRFRDAMPRFVETCRRVGVTYKAVTFYEGNLEVIDTLRTAALQSKGVDPRVWESLNAAG